MTLSEKSTEVASIVNWAPALIAVVSLFCIANLAKAQTVYRIDGRVFENVDNFEKIDEFFTFDKNGKTYSIPESQVQKIIGKDGKLLYEKLDLLAERTRRFQGDEHTEYTFSRNGKKLGKGKWVDAGEFQITEGNIPDGVYQAYFDSGELKRTFSFKNGSLNGLCEVFFRSGIIERKGTFKNGKEIGKSELYYPDGTLKGVSMYKDGKKNGPTILYYPSGKIKAKLQFKDSVPDGKQVMYYENGNVESEVEYKNGEKYGPVKFYYESGKLKMEGRFVSDELDGVVITYYESGKIKRRKTFVGGRILEQ